MSGCASTYYTTDGSEPTIGSPVYSTPISISSNTTLKFFSVDNAGNSESVKTETYVIIGTTYTVGGTMSGLAGTVVLQNNVGDDLIIMTNGSFPFATPLADGLDYDVTVSTQPSGQTCSVSNESGTINGANVTDVQVNCVDGVSPTVTVTSPADGDNYDEGDTISFTGSGSDPEDGALTGGSLVWTSSIDGQIGTGTSFTRDDLTVGIHAITLTATDGDGATGTASVNITISSTSGESRPTLQWTVQPGTSRDDACGDIAVDSSGNVYATGYTSGGLDGNTSNGGYDIFITKYSNP